MKERVWLDQPANVKKLWYGFLGVLAITVLAEFFVGLHPHFSIESVFSFHAWYGFLACGVMILFAKALGLLLKQKDTYYEASDNE